MSVFWNTGALDLAVRRWERQVLTEASEHLRDAIKGTINIQGHPWDRRSEPGEAPRVEKGNLLRSWTYMLGPPAILTMAYSDVYSPLGYSYVLEVGGPGTFGTILPRPYIRRALLAEEAALARILTQPLP